MKNQFASLALLMGALIFAPQMAHAGYAGTSCTGPFGGFFAYLFNVNGCRTGGAPVCNSSASVSKYVSYTTSSPWIQLFGAATKVKVQNKASGAVISGVSVRIPNLAASSGVISKNTNSSGLADFKNDAPVFQTGQGAVSAQRTGYKAYNSNLTLVRDDGSSSTGLRRFSIADEIIVKLCKN